MFLIFTTQIYQYLSVFSLFALLSDEPKVFLLEYSQTSILHAAHFWRVVKCNLCFFSRISSPDFSDFLEKRPVLVTANGSVSWTLSGYFYTSCDVNFFYFPFDIQTCDIILVDTKSNWETQLIPSEDSVYLNLLMGNSKWGFLDSLVSVYTDAMALTFTNVRISLSMRRAPICFFTTMLLPVWLLSIVSVLALSLQPECGEKISLSIACLMAFFLTQVTISDHMPTSWTVMPLISRCNLLC